MYYRLVAVWLIMDRLILGLPRPGESLDFELGSAST